MKADTHADALATLRTMLAPCRLCPRDCRVDRSGGERGVCGVGAEAVVASAGPHFGEESCLVGRGGSGTIFLGGCNLRCVFCQNFDISHFPAGAERTPHEIARLMLRLQAEGCENINFVTPTHVTHALAEAVVAARRDGLAVPVVWNSNAYEKVEVLRRLEGLVDIYMPDFKFSRSGSGNRYGSAPDYPEVARSAVREMHRQVGDLDVAGGVARRGLLVRHLVMPGGEEEGREILDFLASLSPSTFVNVMGQYRPAGPVRPGGAWDEIARPPSPGAIAGVRRHAARLGLRLDEGP
ncbi:MAG: radical SAM protein [Planctomycetes bacterium]|nr:radical SAM protein [Planctomycetota bacterium]